MITPSGRAFLTQHETTTTELSRATGISKTLIQRALAGTRNMSLDKVAAVSAYLGITLDAAMQTFYHPHIRPRGNPGMRRGFDYKSSRTGATKSPYVTAGFRQS